VTRHFVLWGKYIKKLNEVEGKEQYHVEISNMHAVLENLDTEVDINGSWETIRENVSISAPHQWYLHLIVVVGFESP
jgi:hypothetical protein